MNENWRGGFCSKNKLIPIMSNENQLTKYETNRFISDIANRRLIHFKTVFFLFS